MVVSTNYRLGPWGFFYLNEKETDQEYQGNWGLLDQQFWDQFKLLVHKL